MVLERLDEAEVLALRAAEAVLVVGLRHALDRMRLPDVMGSVIPA